MGVGTRMIAGVRACLTFTPDRSSPAYPDNPALAEALDRNPLGQGRKAILKRPRQWLALEPVVQGRLLPGTHSPTTEFCMLEVFGLQVSTPAVDRDLAGRAAGSGLAASRPGRPPLIIWCCDDNQRSDGGRRPQRRGRPCAVAGRAGGVAGPGRGTVWPGGSAATGWGVCARTAGGPAAQELLDDRRARRGCQP